MNIFQRIQQHESSIRFSSEMDSPMVRWGLLLAIAILLWAILFSPWMDWKEERESAVATQIQKASRLMAMQSKIKEWREAQESFQKAKIAASAGIFSSLSATEAQADLLVVLSGLVRESGLIVQSQRFLDGEKEGDWGRRVRISINVKGGVDGVYHLLDALAKHQKILVVEKLFLGNLQKVGAVQIQVAGFLFSHGEAE